MFTTSFLFSARQVFPLAISAPRYYSSVPLLDPSLPLLQLLQLAIDHQSLNLTRKAHGRVFLLGFDQHSLVATKLISAYSICHNPLEARHYFDSICFKNVYLWNTMMNGYAKNHLHRQSFGLFVEMCRSEVSPDDFTLSTLSKVAGLLGDCNAGEAVHGKCIRTGFDSDTVVANSILSMYCKCKKLNESHKVFDDMPHRNVSSFNALIAAFVAASDDRTDCVWGLIKSMLAERLKLDPFTVSSLLPLCRGDGGWKYGTEIHCYIVKNELDLGVDCDVHVGCSLIDMYSRIHKSDTARRVFDRMKHRNVFAWTALINGYVQNGSSEKALTLFSQMQQLSGIEPNRVSLLSILPACSSHAGLMGGKQIHGFAIRKELNCESSIFNALIDMYSKCGSLNSARRVFDDGSFCRDAISWSSMISGYGLHGKGQEAISLYNTMLQHGTKPDKITIVSVLSACGRSGLVNQGLAIYNSAINEYGIKPTVEICACVVDIFGRAGQLNQAMDFIKAMPIEPSPSVWGALFSASALHGNSEMRDFAHKILLQIEPENPSNYISLSNLYASSKDWDVVAEVRSVMKQRQLKKLPGCSWISISMETHSFLVADKSHPSSATLHDLLDELVLAMKGVNNNPDFLNVF